MAYMSLSVAAKYNERVAFKFAEMSHSFKFEVPHVLLMNLIQPESLRMLEFELLRKLNFRIGDAAEVQQVSRIYETVT